MRTYLDVDDGTDNLGDDTALDGDSVGVLLHCNIQNDKQNTVRNQAETNLPQQHQIQATTMTSNKAFS